MLSKFFENFTGKNLCWSLFLIKFLINFKFKHTMEGNMVRKPRESVLISLMQSWFNYLNRNFNLKNSVSVLRSLFRYWHWNFSFQILISVMKSQFQNPYFSHEIAVSPFESDIKFPNPNFSYEEVLNSRVSKLSYETELRKMTTHFELLSWSRKIKNHASSY